MTSLHHQIAHLKRIGDRHGHAPRCCSSQQYLPTTTADTVSGDRDQVATAAEARRIYRALGLTYCRRCGGWSR